MSDLDAALAQITARAGGYREAAAYYGGEHRLAFATDKFKNAFGPLFRAFADNLCPAVVDAVADRLVVTGFQVEGAPPKSVIPNVEGALTADPPAAQAAWQLWQANRMDRRAGEVHAEAVRCGDAYVIVWPDAQNKVRLWPQRAALMTVAYDPDTPGALLWAAKAWMPADGHARVTLYYPDRVEKYRAPNPTPQGLPQDGKGLPLIERILHPYGRVPVFHFANNGALGEWGRSDLTDVIPLQDALNKAMLDMLVAMEFTAFPQRWITGLEVEQDELTGRPIAPFVPGEDRIWTVGDKDVKFGEFPAAGLENYLHVQDSIRAEIARVSGTPVHYLMLIEGRWPSGEALRIAEVRLTHKIRDRQLSFGETWSEAVSFALRLAGPADAAPIVVPEWADAAPHSEFEQAQTLQIKQGLGVPDPVLWAELGYTEAEIAAMQQAEAQRQAQQIEAMRQQQLTVLGDAPNGPRQ